MTTMRGGYIRNPLARSMHVDLMDPTLDDIKREFMNQIFVELIYAETKPWHRGTAPRKRRNRPGVRRERKLNARSLAAGEYQLRKGMFDYFLAKGITKRMLEVGARERGMRVMDHATDLMQQFEGTKS